MIQEMCRTCHPSAHVPQETGPWSGPNFIAFTGLAQSGKSTCAQHLRDKFGFGVLTFAAPLKRMLATLTPVHNKEATPYILGGKTVRHALQTLGTEWGRQLIASDIWIRAARETVERIRLTGAPGIACDDARFDNECELVRELGGIVIALERPGTDRMDHASEAGVSPHLISATITAEDVGTLIGKLDAYLARA